MDSAALSRRTLFAAALPLGMAIAAPGSHKLPVPGRLPLLLFSKHLHWADWGLAAKITKEVGAEGADLTVRAGGHVLPERVKEDLPRAVEIFAKAGAPVGMITTDIQTKDSPHAADILQTAKRLGINHYRWRDFTYDPKRPIPEQLAAIKPKIHELAKWNQDLGMSAMYHIHSGFHRVGTSVWDLWGLLKDENADAVAFNFDAGHATVEGGFGGWINSLHLVLPHTRGIAVKDFYWEKNSKGEWRPRWCAIGQGMVDWPRFFGMLKDATVPMPLQLHLEYDELGSAATGKKTLDIERSRVEELMRKDVEAIKRFRRDAGLA